MKRIRIYARKSREKEAALESQSGYETLRKAEVGVVIVPNNQYIVGFFFNTCQLICQ